MKVLRARIGKLQGLRRGVVRIDGGAGHVALGQADHFALFQIDSGKDDHGSGG